MKPCPELAPHRPRRGFRDSCTRLQVAAAAGLALMMLLACGERRTDGATPPEDPPQPLPVSVLTVQPQDVPVSIEALGQAEGSREVEVRARVGGLLEQQLYQEGEPVRAGAPLFRIERAPLEIARAQAGALLAQEAARLEQAGREAERLQSLAQEHAISRREHDNAKSAQAVLQASLQLAQARVREADLNLSHTVVNAPIGGLTGRAQKSVGSLVGPGNDSLLTTIVQIDPIRVRFALSPQELQRVRQLSPAQRRQVVVQLLDAQGQPLPRGGRLDFSGSTADARLGTVALRAAFPNAEADILPGQLVQVRLLLGTRSALLVPQAAVVQGEREHKVWAVRDGRAAPVPVQLGDWVGSNWAVHAGLQAGDQVIVDGLLKLRAGMPVAPRAVSAAGVPASPATH